MGLQPHVPFATLLAGVAVAHQTGDAQVLIQPRWVLVAYTAQGRIIETGDINLYIFYHHRADRERDTLYNANDFLHIGLDIAAVVDVCSEQDCPIADTAHPGDVATFVNAHRDLLNVALALPLELDRKRATFHYPGFACP